MTRAEFIKQIGSSAKKVCEGTPFFASTMIAQAALESNNGSSVLSTRGKNFFGIKADPAWKGDKILLPTREVIKGKSIVVQAPFRAYKTLEESFRDRNSLLAKPRYIKSGVPTSKTPEAQAYAFQLGGYATDPVYAELISQIINGQVSLKSFDETHYPDLSNSTAINLRSKNNISPDNVIRIIQKGDKLAYVTYLGAWYFVYHYKSHTYGYVSSLYVK